MISSVVQNSFVRTRNSRFLDDLFLRSFLSQRSVVTQSLEPPLDSLVPERPCTVVLVENMGCYAESWEPTFSRVLPSHRGLHFCHVSLEIGTGTKLEHVLEELSSDLAKIPSTVLVARGPLWSVVAQYYLESLPLAGLVMVDPVVLAVQEDSTMGQSVLQRYDLLCCSKGSTQTTSSERAREEFRLLERIVTNEEEKRPLKLEPGSVPMLVLHSQKDLRIIEAAKSTAQRHISDGDTNNRVSVVDLTNHDKVGAIDTICDWIDNHVI